MALMSTLRTRVCTIAWQEDSLCYGHVAEGCKMCSSGARPNRSEWEEHLPVRPLLTTSAL